MRSVVQNASDEKQVKDASIKEKIGREREIADMQSVLATVQGRRFIWRYLEFCGIFQTSFSPSGSQTFFNEGQRTVGLKLMADITEANDEALILMMRENKKGN